MQVVPAIFQFSAKQSEQTLFSALIVYIVSSDVITQGISTMISFVTHKTDKRSWIEVRFLMSVKTSLVGENTVTEFTPVHAFLIDCSIILGFFISGECVIPSSEQGTL